MNELVLAQKIMHVMQDEIDYDTFIDRVNELKSSEHCSRVDWIRALNKCKDLCCELIAVAGDNY